MANMVANVLRIEGIANLPIYTDKYDAKLGRYTPVLDFEKIIRTPDAICTAGTRDERAAIAALYHAIGIYLSLYPENKHSFFRALEAKSADLKEALSLAAFGSEYVCSLLTWGESNATAYHEYFWGCESNAQQFMRLDENTVRFETDWCAPLPIVRAIQKLTCTGVSTDHVWAPVELFWASESTECGKFTIDTYGQESKIEYDLNSKEGKQIFEYCWKDNP